MFLHVYSICNRDLFMACLPKIYTIPKCSFSPCFLVALISWTNKPVKTPPNSGTRLDTSFCIIFTIETICSVPFEVTLLAVFSQITCVSLQCLSLICPDNSSFIVSFLLKTSQLIFCVTFAPLCNNRFCLLLRTNNVFSLKMSTIMQVCNSDRGTCDLGEVISSPS